MDSARHTHVQKLLAAVLARNNPIANSATDILNARSWAALKSASYQERLVMCINVDYTIASRPSAVSIQITANIVRTKLQVTTNKSNERKTYALPMAVSIPEPVCGIRVSLTNVARTIRQYSRCFARNGAGRKAVATRKVMATSHILTKCCNWWDVDNGYDHVDSR
jgi:hypothetical protein